MSVRTRKVGRLLQKEICDIIEKDLTDPRLDFVTITGVEISEDISSAKVYFTTLGGADEEEKALKSLNQAKGYIRAEIGKRVRLKVLPNLSFLIDDLVKMEMRISDILREIKKEEENR